MSIHISLKIDKKTLKSFAVEVHRFLIEWLFKRCALDFGINTD